MATKVDFIRRGTLGVVEANTLGCYIEFELQSHNNVDFQTCERYKLSYHPYPTKLDMPWDKET